MANTTVQHFKNYFICFCLCYHSKRSIEMAPTTLTQTTRQTQKIPAAVFADNMEFTSAFSRPTVPSSCLVTVHSQPFPGSILLFLFPHSRSLATCYELYQTISMQRHTTAVICTPPQLNAKKTKRGFKARLSHSTDVLAAVAGICGRQ